MNVVSGAAAKAASGFASVTGSAAAAVGLGDPAQAEPASDLNALGEQFKLSKTTRMIGFGVCFGVGFLLNLLAFGRIFQPVSFALFMGIGHVLIIASTGFFIGFVRQAKYMFDEKRRISTAVYLTSLILIFVCALGIPDAQSSLRLACCIIFSITLYCAGIWYSASYFPFAQTMLKSVVCGVCGRLRAVAGA
jgi:hypothetical protein